eukprot:bmy_02934T0
MMFIMWFSGLRGAIPYALSLHLDLEPMEKRQLIGTTTISIVLFTILLLGGSTMPLIRFADIEDARARRRNKKDVNLSKTEKMGNTVESEHLSELTEEEYEAHYIRRQDLKGFLWLDAKYLNPFFTRRLTQEVGRRPGVPCLPPSGPAVAKSRVGREDPHAGLGPPPRAHPDENPHQQVVRRGAPRPLRLRGRRAGAAVTERDAVAPGQPGPQQCHPAYPRLPGRTPSKGPRGVRGIVICHAEVPERRNPAVDPLCRASRERGVPLPPSLATAFITGALPCWTGVGTSRARSRPPLPCASSRRLRPQQQRFSPKRQAQKP